MAKILTTPHGATATIRPVPHFRYFTITLRHTTLGRTPLDEWSARRRDLFLTTHTRDKTSVPPAGFEPATPTSKWPLRSAVTILTETNNVAGDFGNHYRNILNPLPSFPLP
jgi:hypothetical protein